MNIAKLRELRLYHWRMNREARRSERMCRTIMSEPGASESADLYDKKAMMHIGFIQTLNAFFPVGDTAEADSIKAGDPQ